MDKKQTSIWNGSWNRSIDIIVSGVLASVVLGISGWIWQLATDGGLVRMLGGVSKEELESLSNVPQDAVIAFDYAFNLGECPKGWAPFEAGQGRMIIGASSEYPYRVPGGEKRVVLSPGHMPKHQHWYLDIYYSELVSGQPSGYGRRVDVPAGFGSNGSDHDNSGWAQRKTTESSGEGQAHENMPPYIALHLYVDPPFNTGKAQSRTRIKVTPEPDGDSAKRNDQSLLA